jgi:acyl-CoA hydrolase
MDPRGYFNYGLANSVTSAVVTKAKKIVVEVNEHVPYCLGGNQESIHISRIDHVVEGKNLPLPRYLHWSQQKLINRLQSIFWPKLKMVHVCS